MSEFKDSTEDGKGSLVALRMVIDPRDHPSNLVEAYIIETLEAGSCYLFDPVVRYEELFLPAHEHILAIFTVFVMKVCSSGLFCQRFPSRKMAPMLHIIFL